MKTIGYVRTSMPGSVAGAEAQRREITATHRVTAIYEDCSTGKNLRRPGLTECLNALTPGDILVVSKVDRLSRSMDDFSTIMERANSEGWTLFPLDVGSEICSAASRKKAKRLIDFAEFEGERLSLRTKEALAVKRSQGVRLGRPPVVSAEVVAQIRKLRETPMSYRRIAEQLDHEGVPTAHGAARWHANTVRVIFLVHQQREMESKGRIRQLTADRIRHLRQDGLSYREVGQRLEAAGIPAPRGGTTWHASTIHRLLTAETIR